MEMEENTFSLNRSLNDAYWKLSYMDENNPRLSISSNDEIIPPEMEAEWMKIEVGTMRIISTEMEAGWMKITFA